jgi:putative ABC transport system permease protein
VPADNGESPCVVLVNRTLAARHWPDANAIGAVLGVGAQQCTIVGIAADVRHRGPATPAQPEMYLSYRQRAPRGGAAVVVRSSDAQAGAAVLRTIIRSEDAALVPGPVRALDDMLGRTLAQPRFMSVVVSVLSGLAFLLAILGVHGLLSFGVARRTREIGVRIAVGAAHRDVVMLVVRQAALTIGAGAILGLLAALATSRFMSGLLFEIRPGDPLTLAAVATAMCAAGALATILPIRRALRVDPVNALRME